MSADEALKANQRVRSDGVYELFILSLTIFSLLVLAAYALLPVTDATRRALLLIDIPISVIFLLDSFRSLSRAPDKRAYLKWGWLDFLGSIPLIMTLRIARIGRLLRAWRIVRTRRPRQVGEDLDQNRARGVALVTVFLAIVVLTTATMAVLEFESKDPEANILSGDDAFWWAIVTMATVGYGDHHPITTGGRVAAVALMTVGVGIFGVLASYLASFFLPQDREDDGANEIAEIRAELAEVNARLDAIQAALEAQSPTPQEDVSEESG